MSVFTFFTVEPTSIKHSFCFIAINRLLRPFMGKSIELWSFAVQLKWWLSVHLKRHVVHRWAGPAPRLSNTIEPTLLLEVKVRQTQSFEHGGAVPFIICLVGAWVEERCYPPSPEAGGKAEVIRAGDLSLSLHQVQRMEEQALNPTWASQ